jgi:hypothetical protein
VFNPVVIPLPTALMVVAMLAVAAWAWDRWTEQDDLLPITPPPPVAPGRHRLERIIERGDVPTRDWAAIVADRILAEHRAATAKPLPIIEMVEIAGHDDRSTIEFPHTAARADDDTRELATVQ